MEARFRRLLSAHTEVRGESGQGFENSAARGGKPRALTGSAAGFRIGG
jgi:hypothetical protein